MRRITMIAAGALIPILLLAGCSTPSGTGEADQNTAGQATATPLATTETTSSLAGAPQSTEEAAEVDWAALPSTDVALTDSGLAITEAGTYVLTGTTTGAVTVDTDGAVRIVLDNATIDSSKGAAIEVVSAEVTVLELADGTENSVSDAATRSDEEIDGAIYSADDLVITGTGTLKVDAGFADGIVGKDDLWIESGTIEVTSVDDGIRGKDSLTVNGGTITVDATGDAMKASNDTDLSKGQLTITSGDISITTGDDAIKSEQALRISGGTIDITQSVEGIEAPVIVIDGGDITLNASDDGINASTSEIITEGLGITINGGTLSVTMGQGDTDAIDSNGDLAIHGGTVSITAQSPFDFDGTGTLDGGTVTVNGEQVTELTNQMMGPGGMGGGMGGGTGGAPGEGGGPGGR